MQNDTNSRTHEQSEEDRRKVEQIDQALNEYQRKIKEIFDRLSSDGSLLK